MDYTRPEIEPYFRPKELMFILHEDPELDSYYRQEH